MIWIGLSIVLFLAFNISFIFRHVEHMTVRRFDLK